MRNINSKVKVQDMEDKKDLNKNEEEIKADLKEIDVSIAIKKSDS